MKEGMEVGPDRRFAPEKTMVFGRSRISGKSLISIVKTMVSAKKNVGLIELPQAKPYGLV